MLNHEEYPLVATERPVRKTGRSGPLEGISSSASATIGFANATSKLLVVYKADGTHMAIPGRTGKSSYKEEEFVMVETTIQVNRNVNVDLVHDHYSPDTDLGTETMAALHEAPYTHFTGTNAKRSTTKRKIKGSDLELNVIYAVCGMSEFVTLVNSHADIDAHFVHPHSKRAAQLREEKHIRDPELENLTGFAGVEITVTDIFKHLPYFVKMGSQILRIPANQGSVDRVKFTWRDMTTGKRGQVGTQTAVMTLEKALEDKILFKSESDARDVLNAVKVAKADAELDEFRDRQEQQQARKAVRDGLSKALARQMEEHPVRFAVTAIVGIGALAIGAYKLSSNKNLGGAAKLLNVL